MKKLTITIAVMTWVLVSLAGDDGSDRFDVTASDKAFFAQLQHAILTGNAKWISRELCWYPFPIYLPSGDINLTNEEELKSRFNRIFSPKIKEVVRNQSPDSLSKSGQGVMVGDGEIWFTEMWVTNENKMGWENRITAISDPPIPM